MADVYYYPWEVEFDTDDKGERVCYLKTDVERLAEYQRRDIPPPPNLIRERWIDEDMKEINDV